MDYLRSDEEQAEALKQWLKKNGTGLAVAVVAGIGSVLGYQQWQAYQADRATDAAARYQQVLDASATDFSLPDSDSQFQTLLSAADGLRQAHGDSNYAALAAAVVAAQAIEKGEFDLAVSQLTFAEATIDAPELKALMAMRLARLELHLGEADAALARVLSIESKSIEASVAELRGDIQVVLGNLSDARAAYDVARDALVSSGLNTALVDLKLSALPEG